MYSRKKLTGRQTIEDSLDSPFRDLGLLIPSHLSQGSYRVVLGAKPSLPAAGVAVACLEFLVATGSSAKSISISRLANDENSPGKAMKLTAESLVEYLSDFEELHLTNSAGIQQLVVSGDPLKVRAAILKEHFGSSNV
jgi:hypothetical protein